MKEQNQTVHKLVPSLKALKTDYPDLKTVLFDMDGTLFNTEKYHVKALLQMANELNLKPPYTPQEVYELMVGKADHLLFEIIKNWPGVPSTWTPEIFIQNKNQKLLEIFQFVSPEEYFLRDLKHLINDIQVNNIQLGLVTSSEKIITLELLKQTQLEKDFNYILTRDDSLKVKPDPWPYIHTMTHFKTEPSHTIIFEDSKVGLEAARNSGAHAIKAEWY